MRGFVRPFLAEFIGTFAFVLIAAGVVVANQLTKGGVGVTGVALAQGLTLAIMISSLGAVSGGHFNPAVTLGLHVIGRLDRITLISYTLAQLAGAGLAGLVLRLLFWSQDVWRPVQLGTPMMAPDISIWAALLVEVLLTFILMLAVLGTRIDPMAQKIGGFGVGLVYAAGVLMGSPLSGAAMNPIRAFGPALGANYWPGFWWIYWIGPAAGAALASWLYTRHISETI